MPACAPITDDVDLEISAWSVGKEIARLGMAVCAMGSRLIAFGGWVDILEGLEAPCSDVYEFKLYSSNNDCQPKAIQMLIHEFSPINVERKTESPFSFFTPLGNESRIGVVVTSEHLEKKELLGVPVSTGSFCSGYSSPFQHPYDTQCPTPRYHATLTALDSRFALLFGGCVAKQRDGHIGSAASNQGENGTHREYPNDLWLLDTSNWKWRLIATQGSSKPGGRAGHSAGLFGHYLLIYGGHCGSIRGPKGTSCELWALDLRSYTWDLGDTGGPARSLHGSFIRERLPAEAKARSAWTHELVIAGYGGHHSSLWRLMLRQSPHLEVGPWFYEELPGNSWNLTALHLPWLGTWLLGCSDTLREDFQVSKIPLNKSPTGIPMVLVNRDWRHPLGDLCRTRHSAVGSGPKWAFCLRPQDTFPLLIVTARSKTSRLMRKCLSDTGSLLIKAEPLLEAVTQLPSDIQEAILGFI